MENTKQPNKALVYIPTIKAVTKHRFEVPSQSEARTYLVQRIPHTNNWHCNCEHFHWAITRKDDFYCYHISACILYKEENYRQMNVERNNVKPQCQHCMCTRLKKRGFRHLSCGKKRQRYTCTNCNKRIVLVQPGFIGHVAAPQIITEALDLYASGVSYRNLGRHIKRAHNVTVNHTTIMRWMHKFTDVVTVYLDGLFPKVSGIWSLDEMTMLVNDTDMSSKGFRVWVWSIIDPKTKFLIATQISKRRETRDAQCIIQKGAKNGNDPTHIITDSLKTYAPAIFREFDDRVCHVMTKAIRDGFTNWPVERWHNEVRENTKTRRGLGNDRSAQTFMDFLRVYHNCIRPHMGLGGKTPAEVAGLNLDLGSDRFMGMIERSQPKPRFVTALGKRIEHVNIIISDDSTRVTQKSYIPKKKWREINDILSLHGFERVKFEDQYLWLQTAPKPQDELNN